MNHMLSRRTRPSITSLVAVFLIVLPAMYVLSYAPATRMFHRTAVWEDAYDLIGTDTLIKNRGYPPGSRSVANSATTLTPGTVYVVPPEGGSLHPVYEPVEWLIDHTPLRTPLLAWAGIWGVRGESELASFIRMTIRHNSNS